MEPSISEGFMERLVELIDVSIGIAAEDYLREKEAGISEVRSEQYEMILRNLRGMRGTIVSDPAKIRPSEPRGHRPGFGGFTRFADEWGPLSERLMDSFHALERYYQNEL